MFWPEKKRHLGEILTIGQTFRGNSLKKLICLIFSGKVDRNVKQNTA